jgi:hypothetical protein
MSVLQVQKNYDLQEQLQENVCSSFFLDTAFPATLSNYLVNVYVCRFFFKILWLDDQKCCWKFFRTSMACQDA